MSTTKDRQGPYTVERIEMKGRDWWTVVGPNAGGTPAMDNATAKDLCDRLNAAYQAGQADRDKIDKSGEAVRGTGKVLTEQWVNACIGALERALHPVVIHGATTDTEDVRHAITTLRYARDNGYLSAPAKAPAGMVEAGNAMKEAIGQIAYELEEGMPLTDDSLCITEAERTVSKWDAALKSNTPEHGN